MLKAFLTSTALAVLALPLASAAKDQPDPVGEVEWTYSGDRLQFSREGSHVSLDADEAPAVFADLARAEVEGAPIAFALDREAGSLACTGSADEDGEAAGTCRFAPDRSFLDALAARGIEPEDDDLLSMALVDAHLATIDDLARLGFKAEDSGDVVAISAMGVTGAYAASLAEAGLKIEDLENLIGAKAVGVDAAWVREMADAGYAGLDIEQAIEMRALDITPDYARRMARVLAATGGN
jgi:hypothetical protein